MTTGTLYGVGVGPGDPELVTVKAYRIMKESPVIAYPRKRKGSKSYAYAIAEQYIDQRDKEMLGLVFPMTKDKAILEREWNQTVSEVYERLAQGRDVAFITEGDPMLYSTFIHMMRLMQEKHPDIQIVSIPGISSVNGVASRLGLPLADGDEHVAVIPATDDREQMRQALLNHDCVVFLKVAKVIDLMIDVLAELDLLNKASVVTKVTSGEEVVWPNVADLKGLDLEYLTLMVVRK
ncbi:precorrin-2 C(20)-methyltransferase [Aneurinibacillus aneurinilyticus]|jgi:precorrin-2/cobalt-factor-2 C20-methyltransferase|uniref:Precorrin-2 C(20)-methyltransferase n=2 Tax=Aneurinibacillus aneurinilyticus TaxID=1391 RepID=A0A848CQ27_ANEAE|nr:precorrin-2 C(20)-methyltransferase [Aneurinibacillus aneurinilyticus]ERI05187.1 precorrin-2 C(20)-methyltransferase [Aneurinibacillus aneurinilyticus ATCC 12856]MCI1694126.1 precorrin-2 C(20)-methyltransferase [Aneurinibacillus aneurinilyticus]MED0672432.1 precorrin-2 C(20)-methyltransferase [Aneurinibacillus aneurinilyticus]MED0708150.1 precorrin-2 C(20)-methyltransferase [Aneurinibacillus aneurinilyticus]MED0721497.1 precorrin-2 C(20)-methyltransferase [Aneurinibacillus aneurinilyticus]